MEPLCQTQMPAGGHDSSELVNRLEIEETKLLESEQRCRKLLNDLQKVKKAKRFFLFDTKIVYIFSVKNVDKHLKMMLLHYVNN